MKSLNLEDAAKLLMIHPKNLQGRAKSGEIPGAKPGKCWVFIEADLFEWLRLQYTTKRQDVSKEEVVCSLKEKKPGITSSVSKEKLYTDLLAPTTKNRPALLKPRLTVKR